MSHLYHGKLLVITRGYDILRSRFYCAPMVCSSVAALDHLVHLWCRCCPWHRGRRLNTGRVTARYFNMCLGLCWKWSVRSVGDFKHGIPWWMHTSRPWGPSQWGMNMQVPAVLAWYVQEVFWTSIKNFGCLSLLSGFFFFPDGFRIDSHWLTISSTPLIGNWRYIYIWYVIYIYGIYYIYRYR